MHAFMYISQNKAQSPYKLCRLAYSKTFQYEIDTFSRNHTTLPLQCMYRDTRLLYHNILLHRKSENINHIHRFNQIQIRINGGTCLCVLTQCLLSMDIQLVQSAGIQSIHYSLRCKYIQCLVKKPDQKYYYYMRIRSVHQSDSSG